MPRVFQVLHISDLHIGAVANQAGFPATLMGHPPLLETHGTAQLDALRNVIEHENFDGLLITGDLACDGSTENQQAARAVIDDFAKLRSDLPIGLLPGNHDRYQLHFDPGGTVFDREFATWWKAGLRGVQEVLVLPSAAQPQVVVLGADFSLPAGNQGSTALGVMGEGMVLTVTTQALIAKTADWHAKGVAVAWASHFPPSYPDQANLPIGVPPPNVSSELQLLQPDFLINAAIQAGVKNLFTGHTHRQRRYQVGPNKELTVFCTGSTLSAAESENWMQELDLTANGTDLAVNWHQRRFDGRRFP